MSFAHVSTIIKSENDLSCNAQCSLKLDKIKNNIISDNFAIVDVIISIKHDLARSCFQLWPKISDEGDILREKNSRGVSQEFFLDFFSPSEPILRAIIENMISPDYVLCYIPRAMAILS